MDDVDRRVKSIIGNGAAHAYGLRRHDDYEDGDEDEDRESVEDDEAGQPCGEFSICTTGVVRWRKRPSA